MYMNHRLFSFVLMMLFGCGVSAQIREGVSAAYFAEETGHSAMSLKECMLYALENSAKILVQQIEIDDARLARRDAVLKAFTPSVEAGSYAYSNFGRSVDPETNTYVSTTSFNNGYSATAGIALFDGFSAINNAKIAKTSLMMGIEQEQKIRDEVCLATMEAFYNVVYYTELSQILDSQVTTLRDALALVKRQEELGQKGYADVVQTDADLADLEYNLIIARNERANALITLKDIMFWDEDKELELSGGNPSVEALPLAGSAAIADFAAEHNPSVLIAGAELEKAKLKLYTAKWGFSPRISLNAGWSTSYYTYPGRPDYVAQPFDQQFRNNGGEYLQFSVTFPIFNRLQTFSNLRRMKNECKRAETQYNSAVRQLRAEVERAVQDCNGAWSALNQAERRESVQEEAWRLSVKQFEQGLISPIDFRKASDNLLGAKTARLSALLKWKLKSSVVKYYDGVSYIDQF